MKNLEIRSSQGLELREAADGKPAVLVGYAAVFNSQSEDLGGFVEIIRPGAFAKSLSSDAEIMALIAHDWDEPLARRSAGTLKLEEDEKGLRVEITLADTTRAKDLVADIRARNFEGMSFGFKCDEGGDRWTFNSTQGPALRELLSVNIGEVSVTTEPAYTDTEIAVRSMNTAKGSTPKETQTTHAKLNSLRLRLLNAFA